MEQLQQTLNEAIKMGWSYKFIKNTDYTYFICCENQIIGLFENKISYHDLFSIDSGLMDFMTWNNKSDRKIPEIDKYIIRYLYDPDYVYKKMGPMTAEQKINYFNTNAYLPNEMP